MTVEISAASRRLFVVLNAEADSVSDTYIIADQYPSAAITVHPAAGGMATLQISVAEPVAGAVPAGSWVDWAEGAIDTAAGIEISPAITALRLSAITADASALICFLLPGR